MNKPPILLSNVYHYLIRKPEDGFVFPDKKAAMIYYPLYGDVIYLQGDFSGKTKADVVEEIHRAAASMRN